jgi:hypothetical protein
MKRASNIEIILREAGEPNAVVDFLMPSFQPLSPCSY